MFRFTTPGIPPQAVLEQKGLLRPAEQLELPIQPAAIWAPTLPELSKTVRKGAGHPPEIPSRDNLMDRKGFKWQSQMRSRILHSLIACLPWMKT